MKKKILVVFLIVMAGALLFAGGGQSRTNTITMWMQTYGEDLPRQTQMMRELTDKFESETGIRVEVEINSWTDASQRWILVATGGDHPDVGDMWWAWSNSQIGRGRHGPMALNQYIDRLNHHHFIEAALQDVIFEGNVYGIPWRIDVRPMIYRADLFQQAGIAAPPDTWDDLVNYGRRLTTRAADGRIDISGILFNYGVSSDAQDILHWIWQGGGEVTTPDGSTATLNTRDVIDSMQFVRDLLYVHEVVTMDVLDPSYHGANLFISGKGAIRPLGHSQTSDFPPEMLANVRATIPTMGKRRTAYSGAGYMGVLHGTRNMEASVQWLEFLSRDENMLHLAKMSQTFSPSRGASSDAYFANDEWSRQVIRCLEFAKTSQSPSAAWSQISARAPGSPLYDFWADTLLNREPISALAARYNNQTQQMIDRVSN